MSAVQAKKGGDRQAPAPPGPVRTDILRWLEETADDPMPPPPAEWTLEHWHLLVSEHPGLRSWAAYWPSAPEEIVRRLAAEGDWRVRHRIAEKRNLPPDLAAREKVRFGLILIAVEPGSAADQGGLRLGDVLLALDGQPLEDPGQLHVLLHEDRIGTEVTVRLLRGGEAQELKVTVGSR